VPPSPTRGEGKTSIPYRADFLKMFDGGNGNYNLINGYDITSATAQVKKVFVLYNCSFVRKVAPRNKATFKYERDAKK
jgi:hypothetical protein